MTQCNDECNDEWKNVTPTTFIGSVPNIDLTSKIKSDENDEDSFDIVEETTTPLQTIAIFGTHQKHDIDIIGNQLGELENNNEGT